MRFTHYALIPHPCEPRVLLQDAPSGWELPCMERPTSDWDDMSALNQTLSTQLGLHLSTLRSTCLAGR